MTVWRMCSGQRSRNNLRASGGGGGGAPSSPGGGGGFEAQGGQGSRGRRPGCVGVCGVGRRCGLDPPYWGGAWLASGEPAAVAWPQPLLLTRCLQLWQCVWSHTPGARAGCAAHQRTSAARCALARVRAGNQVPPLGPRRYALVHTPSARRAKRQPPSCAAGVCNNRAPPSPPSPPASPGGATGARGARGLSRAASGVPDQLLTAGCRSGKGPSQRLRLAAPGS